jgi:glycine hydroxymethyltransferase
MLILLEKLMHRVYVEVEGKAPRIDQIPKPCEYFDLIAGTGTGGLIALMLGRLRLDIETCKDVYVRMTRHVFETDKTFAGIPYRSTLFKASKLEDAIRECVAEHTVSEAEGNDDDAAAGILNGSLSPAAAAAFSASAVDLPRRSQSTSSSNNYNYHHRASVASSAASYRGPIYPARRGNPNALLYDSRENRTKT